MPEQKHSSQEKSVSCIPKALIPSFANTTGAHRFAYGVTFANITRQGDTNCCC